MAPDSQGRDPPVRAGRPLPARPLPAAVARRCIRQPFCELSRSVTMPRSAGTATLMAPKPLTRRLLIILLTAVAMLLSYATVTPLVSTAHAAGPLISQGKPVTA